MLWLVSFNKRKKSCIINSKVNKFKKNHQNKVLMILKGTIYDLVSFDLKLLEYVSL